MIYIPEEYQKDENEELEEGMTELTCKVCGGKFSVPSSDVGKYCDDIQNSPVCSNPECIGTYERSIAANNIAELKQTTSST